MNIHKVTNKSSNLQPISRFKPKSNQIQTTHKHVKLVQNWTNLTNTRSKHSTNQFEHTQINPNLKSNKNQSQFWPKKVKIILCSCSIQLTFNYLNYIKVIQLNFHRWSKHHHENSNIKLISFIMLKVINWSMFGPSSSRINFNTFRYD